jgi:hypothetical protein
MQPDRSADPADSSLARHRRGRAKTKHCCADNELLRKHIGKEHQRRCGDGRITTSPDEDETTSRTRNISSKILTSRMTQAGCRTPGRGGRRADVAQVPLRPVAGSIKFPVPGRPKYLRWSDFNYVGNQTRYSGTCVPLRGVAFPHLSSARIPCCQHSGRRRPAHAFQPPSRCRA